MPALPGRPGPVPPDAQGDAGDADRRVRPAPGLFADILAGLEPPVNGSICGVITGRRVAYIGGIAAATAAGAAGAIVARPPERAAASGVGR